MREFLFLGAAIFFAIALWMINVTFQGKTGSDLQLILAALVLLISAVFTVGCCIVIAVQNAAAPKPKVEDPPVH